MNGFLLSLVDIKPFMKTFFISLGALFLYAAFSFSQSTSVFAANYFNKDNAQPPLKVGKGFHINDVYKQTKFCFTPESSSKEKLSQQESATTTNINLYYTEDDEQFHELQNQGGTGKISFLNLFSVGGSKLKEFASESYHSTERIVFVAKVDFGQYSFERDPTLEPEPKALIDQQKYDDFIGMYGTHFISGVRKENSIWVILKKEKSKEETSETESSSIGVESKVPFKAKGSFEIKDGSETEKIISSNKYSISVEINGPSLDKSTIEKDIDDVLKEDGEGKIAAIRRIISNAAGKIADPSQAKISQYYYTPFTLYNVKGINWDENKQNELIKLNENVVRVYSEKTALEEMLRPTAKAELLAEFDANVPEFPKKKDYRIKLASKYEEILPTLKNYQTQINSKFSLLESRYKSCCDVKCSQETNCCDNNQICNECVNLTGNISIELGKLDKLFDAAMEGYVEDALIPECQKEKKGYVILYNKSVNPYEIYSGDKYIEDIEGGGSRTYKVNVGTYYLTAKQKSGFLMYPTVNKRTAVIKSVCEEFPVKIGFED